MTERLKRPDTSDRDEMARVVRYIHKRALPYQRPNLIPESEVIVRVLKDVAAAIHRGEHNG